LLGKRQKENSPTKLLQRATLLSLNINCDLKILIKNIGF